MPALKRCILTMNSIVRRQSVWSLQQAAGEAPSLAALQQRIRASQTCLEIVRPLVPIGLRRLIQAGPLQDGEWCLLVQSTAAATKLRLLVPTMLQELNAQNLQITGIRVKILSPMR